MPAVCPHCQQTITVPALNAYDEFFVCTHCHSAIAHHELDILLYAVVFITLITAPLVLLTGINIFIALLGTMLAYHLLRPRVFEPRFRLKLVDLYSRQS
ncbi:hypothetical protein L4C36_17380 [Photobacterium japonica]|uniref:hypothetical protein n=1 Tax=Photobacterium japonica TaxID=2910235 RepID=UPI003D0D5D61